MIELGIQGVLIVFFIIAFFKCVKWVKKYWKVKKLNELYHEQRQEWEAQFQEKDH